MTGVAEYVYRESPIHALHPITKLIWSLSVVTMSFMFTDLMGQALLFLSVLLVAGLGRVLRETLPAFKALFLMAGLFTVFRVFFIQEGQTLLTLLPGTGLGRITDVGLRSSIELSCRMVVMAASFPVLLATTAVKDLVVTLVEKLRVPYIYAFMFVTSLRFIPTFLREMDQIAMAQRSRGYTGEGRNPFRKVVALAPLAVPLLISSVRKAQRMAISMETRGFASGTRSQLHRTRFAGRDSSFLLIVGVMFVAVIFINKEFSLRSEDSIVI